MRNDFSNPAAPPAIQGEQPTVTGRRDRSLPGAARESELIAAIRHTIEVLEQTKQNFKSQRLADLRRQLVKLLER
jgi:hypothetical protein